MLRVMDGLTFLKNRVLQKKNMSIFAQLQTIRTFNGVQNSTYE